MYDKINRFDVKTHVSFVTGVLTNDSTRGGNNKMVNQPVDSWTDEDWTTFRTVLKHELQSKTAEVTFTKLNGDVRVMTCTLNPELLPAKVVTEGEEEKPARTIKNPNNSLPVYDINAEGWRSFVIKNITQVLYKD
tara:strand:- start:87 stop:491 length:405 start_codon:yes stop_codon:yes gene_type:complete